MFHNYVMTKYHVTRPGDCIASLAFENGLVPETIWNHPENAELKRRCKDLYHLIPGEKVFIPGIERREVSKPTEATHVFRRRGVPEIYRVQLLDFTGAPRANLNYLITIEGSTKRGTTDGAGKIAHPIPPNARYGRLVILGSENEETYQLRFGHLEPISQLAGMAARLRNLGYNCLDNHTEIDDRLRRSLLEFQKDNSLPLTGEPDAATKDKLQSVYGA